MTPSPNSRRGRTALAAGLFLALTAVAAIVFLKLFAPAPRRPPLPPFTAYDRAPLRTALAPEAVRAEWDTLIGFGSRFLGQEGFYRTAQHLRATMAEAGLELDDQPNQTPAPHTDRRRILGADGAPLPGVEIYPFFPNQFQPMVTPAGGITAELVLVTDEVLGQRSRFDNAIALVDAERPPKDFQTSWARYAQVGFRAVIVAHREGLAALPWTDPMRMVAAAPVNYVRLAATAGIFAHAGETVTLDVFTRWQDTPNTTLVGVLRAPGHAREAVVITASYDAPSYLPDLAPGGVAAVPVAAWAALVRGLAPYRDQLQRDVIFVAAGSQVMAHDATARLVASLGPATLPDAARLEIEKRRANHDRQGQRWQAITALLADDLFLREPAPTATAIARLSPDQRAALADQFRYVLDTVLLERSEEQLVAHVRFLRTGDQNLTGAEFQEYIRTRQSYDQALALAGFPVPRLLAEHPEFAATIGFRDRCRQRFTALAEFHVRELAAAAAALRLNRLFRGYQRFVVVAPDLVPQDPRRVGTETLGFYMGESAEWVRYIQYPAINNLLQSVLQNVGPGVTVGLEPLAPTAHSTTIAPKIAGMMTPVRNWNALSYVGFALVNTDRAESYGQWGAPVLRPFMRELGSLRQSLVVLGDTVLSLGFGNGRFQPPTITTPISFDGHVYVANVGQSIIPSYPLAGALFGCKYPYAGAFDALGCLRGTLAFTDPYGRYECPFWTSDLSFGVYTPEAFGFGPDGIARFVKDEGPLGQALFKSMQIPLWLRSASDVNLVTFRAAPVAFLDLVNPQTLQAFSSVEFLSRDGLAPLLRFNQSALDGVNTAFLEPDQFVYVTLRSGAPENELVQTVRAFILGTGEPPYTPDPRREIDGRGYLPYDVPFLLDLPEKIARSMLDLNGRRLALQEQHQMADARVREFQTHGEQFLAAAAAPDLPKRDQILLAREAATYAILNHPVLRRAIFEAVAGILWYLGLLVPFVYFLEKLVCGFTDIRRQLITQAVLFLVVFLLLRLLHPAFAMIRSSQMVLLGFVILLISTGITVLFASKFQENLDQLRQRRGQVKGAAVNTLGVVGTAFMLGLNSLHRRRLRTGLTCATLVLMTFAMICFTSIQTNVVETATALGQAPFQGFVVKPDDFRVVSDAELFALQTKYGERFDVAGRWLFFGEVTPEQRQFNPEFEIVHTPAERAPVKVHFDSALVWSPQEPLQARVRLLTTNGWFTTAGTTVLGQTPPVLVPDTMARRLGLSIDDVNRRPVPVQINGQAFVVTGIFDAAALGRLRDLDGRAVLPADVEALRAIRRDAATRLLAGPDEPTLPAHQVVILATVPPLFVPHGAPRLVSVAVGLDRLPYQAARETITTFLEQSGRPIYYGLDGVAFLGQRARGATLAGLLEMIIPLIIAGLTVLNTMRGSVYERQDEILVYNAVGIAPRYVFFIFFAEAIVYAVVGAVLGYLLSQGVGLALTKLGWTGGLTMTFTSLNTLFASLAIAAAVFVSTWFPARAAMRIATPADDLGWRLPEPQGDQMSFGLPFTFDARDRVAVLAFFHRYLVDHGEGGAGRFSAGPPQAGFGHQPDPLAPAAPVPQLQSTIWLKPFDLGVSQELTIALPTDPETREFIARLTLTRLSGTHDAWRRLNRGFVTLLREHFLHWRAVRPAERAEMFAEAAALLDSPPPAGDLVRHG